MKRQILIIITILAFPFVANAQHYKWIRGGGSDENIGRSILDEEIRQLCTDSNGNLYLTAQVGSYNIQLDTFMPVAHNTTASSGLGTALGHIILASYSCGGTLKWAKLLESSELTNSFGLVYDGAANIYCAGEMLGGNKYFDNDTSITAYNYSAFLAKYDTSGHFKWVRFIGPDSTDTHKYTGRQGTLGIDGNGNIHYYALTGNGIQISSFVRSTTGTYDVSYDPAGNLLGAVRMEIDTLGVIKYVTINKKSNVAYAVIHSEDPVVGDLNYHIAAFNAIGNIIWSDTVGYWGTNLNSIYYDGNKYLYSTGNSQGTPFVIGGDTSGPPGDIASIIKLDTNGTASWIYGFTQTYPGGMWGVYGLPNGRVGFSGGLLGKMSHGIDTIRAPASEVNNPLIGIIDTAGKIVFLDQLHTDGFYDFADAITADASGNIYFGGYVEDNVSASGLAGSYTTHGGNSDFFVAKYGYNCNCTALTAPATYFTYSGGSGVPEVVHFSYLGSSVADSVRWSFGDGSTSTSINPIHTYDTAGIYHACLTVYTSCDSSTYCRDIYSTLGMESISGNIDVKMYPNPVSDELIVDGASVGAMLSIYNILGQKVYSQTISTEKQVVDMHNMRPGNYLLQLITKSGYRINRTIIRN